MGSLVKVIQFETWPSRVVPYPCKLSIIQMNPGQIGYEPDRAQADWSRVEATQSAMIGTANVKTRSALFTLDKRLLKPIWDRLHLHSRHVPVLIANRQRKHLKPTVDFFCLGDQLSYCIQMESPLRTRPNTLFKGTLFLSIDDVKRYLMKYIVNFETN